MPATRIMAVDLGASGGKCFVGTFENDSFSMQEVHRFSHQPVTFFISNSHGNITERCYWEDTYLYQNVIEGLQKFRREVSETLDSIGVDTWGSDGQFITRDGDILGKVYCYRDHRLDRMIEEVKKRIDPVALYRTTGIHFQPFNISNQLLWFLLNRKYQLQPGLVFLPMPTLFYFYLGNVRSVDTTWASVTQLMDARTKTWSKQVLEKLGIPGEIMPSIVEPGTVMGRVTEPLAGYLKLNQPRLTAVGSHDTASAYAAAPAQNPQEALIISSGTWSLVGKLLPEPITTKQAMQHNLSNEGGIGNIRFLKNCMGTWIVQELLKVWEDRDGKKMSWEEVLRLVENAQPFVSFIDPDDMSFYNPHNMDQALVEFCKKTGQQVPGSRGGMLRVVYESLALKYRRVNEEICEVCGSPTRAVYIVGGGSKNDMLNQFAADATGLPVIAGPEEATAVGNIMVQAMGLGLIHSLEKTAPMVRDAFYIRDFQPWDHSRWHKVYQRFMKILST
ncbi:MAG: rhamnulokinase [Spirochaetota bacterium]